MTAQTLRWWQQVIAGFDLETTGVDVRTDRVVQWCVDDTLPGRDPRVFAEYVDPGVDIPQSAVDTHGITTAYVRAHGNDPAESLNRLIEELARRVIAKVPIAGQNLAYDFTLLRYECTRLGIPWVEERAGVPLAPVLDLIVLDKHVDPYVKGSGQRKLTPTAARYGVSLVGAHDAVADTLAAVETIRRLAAKYHDEVGNLGMYGLHARQVDWRFEQAADLEYWFRHKASADRRQPDMVIDRCWPVCYDDTHIRS